MLERSVRDAREHRIGCVLIDHARRVRWQRAVKGLQCRIHCGYGKALHLAPPGFGIGNRGSADRKSTRLNSSHLGISYAVFCLKKKKKHNTNTTTAPT